MIVSSFDLPLTDTKIIIQYCLTYTLRSGLNSLTLYEIERRSEQIFIIYRWQRLPFKSELYKKQEGIQDPFSFFIWIKKTSEQTIC